MNGEARRGATSGGGVVAALSVLLAALVLSACGADAPSSAAAPDYAAAVAKAPAKLAQLYADGDAVVGGGQDAYDGKLAAVRGYPVVVNNWASWCGPCRAEFPYFQSQSAEHLDQVAFIGVDSEDSTDAANTFLRDNPLPYPSVEAPAREDFPGWTDTALVGYPNTLFYDAAGKLLYAHQGPYSSEDALAADIQKYALSS